MNRKRKGADAQELQMLDAYWRAANYLTACQLYLLDNPLLREPLRRRQMRTPLRKQPPRMRKPNRFPKQRRTQRSKRYRPRNRSEQQPRWPLQPAKQPKGDGTNVWTFLSPSIMKTI